MNDYPFGQAVKRLRGYTGKTQQQLAEEIGLSSTKVSLLETGRQFVRIGTLCRLAKALNCQPSTLFLLAEELAAENEVTP